VRILAAWYSRTGTTARVIRQAVTCLAAMGHRVTEARIVPLFDVPYPLWLALSFVPRSRFPLSRNPLQVAGIDSCLLALPKWTLSCPPINTFLARHCPDLPPTALLVTCGGWDEARFLKNLAARLELLGAPVLGGLTVKRRDVEAGTSVSPVEGFLETCFPVGPVQEHA
jgi:hypothetical protein